MKLINILKKDFMEKILKKVIKHLKRSFSRKEREINRIRKIPRYNSFTTNLFRHKFIAIDSPSFIGQYREIIERDSYAFNTDSKRPLILDCGSNIGLSIIKFKDNFPDARIIGFEPDPKIFKVLGSNINSFELKNIEIHQKAVWVKNGTLMFEQEGSAGGRVTDESSAKLIKVNSIDLKQFLNANIDLLKIDIEGAEATVLADISDSLTNVKNIFVEYHSLINHDQDLGKILSVLRKNGFRYYLEPGGIISKQPFISRKEKNGFDNLINIWGYKNKK